MTLFIHEMTSGSKSFFRYLPHSPDSEPWGLAVTGGGALKQLAGSAYPPSGHPTDHGFTWQNGRVLGVWQIIVITEGHGSFESAATGLVNVGAGTALVLFPGTWHRYAPDRDHGWTELWLELQGSTLKRLQDAGVLRPDSPIMTISRLDEVRAIITRIHSRIREPVASGFDPELAGAALQLLALLLDLRNRERPPTAIADAVARAELILAQRVEAAVEMPAVAREVGIAYSYFRREFKARTGMAPKRYLLRLRLERARRLLGNSPDSVKVVADRLGFSSPFHLSAAFKREFGIAPSFWRRAPSKAAGIQHSKRSER